MDHPSITLGLPDTLQGWLEATAAITFLLGLVAGGAWWMSALYMQVRHIRGEIAKGRSEALVDRRQGRRATKMIWKTLRSHGERIGRVETTVESIRRSLDHET